MSNFHWKGTREGTKALAALARRMLCIQCGAMQTSIPAAAMREGPVLHEWFGSAYLYCNICDGSVVCVGFERPTVVARSI